MRPCSSEAQFFPGGGDLPVIDKTNLVENIATAVRMLHQINNSDQEVAMMIINLLKAASLAHYPLGELEGLLFALSQGAGPRSMSGLRLDYFNDGLIPISKELFPGYMALEEPLYPDKFGRNADATLNTGESILAQTNAIAGTESDMRYDFTREELLVANGLAEGNLQAQQTGNAISLFTADGVRRTEKSLAGLVSMTAARNAHEMQKEAWGEVMTRTSLDLAYVEEPPLYNGGAGGIKYVGTYSGGQQGGGF